MFCSTRFQLFFVTGIALWLSPAPSGAHGSFHDRLEGLNRQIEASPSDPELLIGRSALYLSHGLWQRALADVDQAATFDPTQPDLDLQRGLIWLQAGDPGRAQVGLARFLVSNPSHTGARLARARALARQERWVEAADEYAHAIRHQSQPVPETYLERSRALGRAEPSNPDASLRCLDQGIAALGSAPVLEAEALALEIRAGRFDAALQRLEGLVSRSPRRETWLARRGDILGQAGRSQEALAAYGEARREIEGLAAHRRQTDAVRELETRVHDAVARLERAGDRP